MPCPSFFGFLLRFPCTPSSLPALYILVKRKKKEKKHRALRLQNLKYTRIYQPACNHGTWFCLVSHYLLSLPHFSALFLTLYGAYTHTRGTLITPRFAAFGAGASAPKPVVPTTWRALTLFSRWCLWCCVIDVWPGADDAASCAAAPCSAVTRSLRAYYTPPCCVDAYFSRCTPAPPPSA